MIENSTHHLVVSLANALSSKTGVLTRADIKKILDAYDAILYNENKEMSFGKAISCAKNGLKIARHGWNGKGQFVVFMDRLHLPSYNTQEPGPKVNDRTARFIGADTPLDSQPYFAMFTSQGKWQPGWLASQADMLANDWYVVSH